MAKKPIELPNGRRWDAQGEAKAYFTALRDRYPHNTPIDDPADHDDLLALLERYDTVILDDPLKAGEGVEYFETRINRAHGGFNVGFWVVRTDGTETDFSFIKAIAASPTPQAQLFADACRSAVDDDIVAAKARYFADHGDQDQRVACPVTGLRLRRADARVDYTLTPFRALALAFRDAQGWDVAAAKAQVSGSQDAQLTATFLDPLVSDPFRRHHHANARVRIVSKSATPTPIRAGNLTDVPLLKF